MQKVKNTSNNATYRPALAFNTVKQAYFIFNGVHSVAHCDTEIFKAAVLTLAPSQWQHAGTHASLLERCDDLADRWYLLLSLAEAKRPMKLYASRRDAEHVLAIH